MSDLIVMSPLIVTNVWFIWLWLRAEDGKHKAEVERDELWDFCVELAPLDETEEPS